MDKPGIVLHKLPSVGIHKKLVQSGNLPQLTGLAFLLAWFVVFLSSTIILYK